MSFLSPDLCPVHAMPFLTTRYVGNTTRVSCFSLLSVPSCCEIYFRITSLNLFSFWFP